ncbi:MAG TPA: C45 family peptidase, partial [Trueperaceae bacterium]|nr:C45 family peptidase [Trueperaceae bacterium]
GRPAGGPDFIVYTTAGCVGMIGMNEAGLSVGINNLMAADGRPGVTWPFAVRAMLEKETRDDALEVLAGARLAGGHNYLVLDADGNGANVEAMPTRSHTTLLASEVVAHTNHCLAPSTLAVERQREAGSQASSEARLADAYRLLGEAASRGDALSIEDVQGVTADTASICHRGTPPLFVATCGAVVMRPATRELWAAAGMPSSEPYVRFTFDGPQVAL